MGVQRAEHAADAARRRYLAVDPTNRLVADQLEADWNDKLRELSDAKDEYERATQAGSRQLSDEQQAQIRALATDLPALWTNPATPMRERKRLIRLLVTDITLTKIDGQIVAHVRLSGGRQHTLKMPRPLRAWEAHTTPPTTIKLIEQAARRAHLRRDRRDPQQQGADRRMGQAVHRRLADPAVPPSRHPLPPAAAPSPGHAHAR